MRLGWLQLATPVLALLLQGLPALAGCPALPDGPLAIHSSNPSLALELQARLETRCPDTETVLLPASLGAPADPSYLSPAAVAALSGNTALLQISPATPVAPTDWLRGGPGGTLQVLSLLDGKLLASVQTAPQSPASLLWLLAPRRALTDALLDQLAVALPPAQEAAQAQAADEAQTGEPSSGDEAPPPAPPASDGGAAPGLLTIAKINADSSWEAPRPTMLENPRLPDNFLVGAGDRFGAPLSDNEYQVWYKTARANGAPVNAHAMWVTKDYQPDWIDVADVEQMAADGVTPVFIFYYFGDEISQEHVSDHYEEYVAWLHRVLADLQGNYRALVVLEPEFNNMPPDGGHHVKEWKPFAELMIRTAWETRLYLPEASVGLCPGDYRSYDLWDILGDTAPHLDFLAFQELSGATRSNWLNEDYEDITSYAFLYTTYLSVVYQKPVLLAYLGISSHSVDDKVDWDQVASLVWSNLAQRLPLFRSVGLFGVLAFSLCDDPNHEGYFGVAEKDWGLMSRVGKPKPYFKAFKDTCRRGRSLGGIQELLFK
jgi:hypothetical protein